jgi:ABC-2 type transport system ATP-binding protein
LIQIKQFARRLSWINAPGKRAAMLAVMNATKPAIIQVTSLTRQFGDFVAVDQVDFAVQQGEVFGLIGSNGAGKSTLIRMLTTLLPPSSGTASVAGFDVVRQAAEVRRHIGYVPQLLSADGTLTAWENLLLSARLYDIPPKEVSGRIHTALEKMGLLPFAHHLVGGFSGGMIRRLEIAQSMLHRPAVLFMDEPTVGLDPTARRAVLDHVSALRRNLGTTILITSHYMEEIEALCDRLGVLSHGKLVAIGTPGELKRRVGPDATLDDVFAALSGGAEGEETKGYHDVRQSRRAARAHA